jgi:hypothetical protein
VPGRQYIVNLQQQLKKNSPVRLLRADIILRLLDGLKRPLGGIVAHLRPLDDY